MLVGYILTICSISSIETLRMPKDSSPTSQLQSSSSLSSTTAAPQLLTSSLTPLSSSVLSSSTQLPKLSSSKHSATQTSQSTKSWPNVGQHQGQQLTSTGGKQSGPINYYQYAQAPFYNFRSPMPSTTGSSSGSFSSLINNLISPFNKVISRRAANGKLFSLADQFNNPSSSNNNNALGSLEYSPSVANLEALNEAVNNVMLGFNGLQPQQANQLAGQLSSYLTGTDAGLKNGKKLLDFPKQWYKLLGEKLSGAGEAAYTATVPLKDTFMHTLKSFYSYIKPSRSQSSSSSPFADAANMVAAAAAAQESLLAGSLNGAGSQNQNNNNNNNNPKRRQSDSYSGYYYNINNKMPMPPTGSSINQQNYPTGRYHHGVYHGHHQHPQMQQSKSSMQPQGRLSSVSAKMNQIQSHGPNSGDMLTLDSQIHASSANGKHYYSSGHHMSKYSDPNIGKSPYDQVLNQVINAQIQGYNMNPKQPNALYQKSKEIFSRFTKKRVSYPQYNYNGNAGNSVPMMADYVHSYQPRLPSQTISKVANKLPTLPLIYNNGQQQQQQEQSQLKQSSSQQTSSHSQQPHHSQSKNSVKSASQAYYTQQPMNQNPFGIQPVYPPPSQPQSAGTASISSTSSPLSTITSVSMSMHQSIGTSYDNIDNVDPQHIQYLLPSNDKQMKNYLDELSGTGSSSSSSNNNNKNDLISSSSNNQESVVYYYDTQSIRQDQPNNQQSNNEPQSSTSQQQQDSEDSSNKKKK